MEWIDKSSFQNLGLYLAKLDQDTNLIECKNSIIQIFIENGYELKFIKDILDSVDDKQIYYITKNIPELKNKVKTSKDQIVQYLTRIPENRKKDPAKTAFKKWK